MNKHTLIDNVGAAARPAPVMPSACETGGCGSAEPDPRLKAAPPSFGIVLVNGVEIAAEAIAQEIQHHPAPDGETAWKEAARALALRELLLQEARRVGVEPDQGVDEAGASEIEEDAVIRTLLAQQVAPAAAQDVECQRYYDSRVERFRTPDLFEASHILIEPEGDDEAAWQSAEAEARAIAAELGNDAGTFAEAARAFSKCPTAHQDGSLGQVRRGELVDAIQVALEALPEGTTGREPVRSSFGWHVLRLQRKIEGRTLPFDVVKDKIVDMLEARAWAVAAANYAAELARSAEIEGILIDPAVIGGN